MDKHRFWSINFVSRRLGLIDYIVGSILRFLVTIRCLKSSCIATGKDHIHLLAAKVCFNRYEYCTVYLGRARISFMLALCA